MQTLAIPFLIAMIIGVVIVGSAISLRRPDDLPREDRMAWRRGPRAPARPPGKRR